jgi:hypothetical protein
MYSPPAFRICSESFEDTKLCTTNLQIPVIFTIINVKYRVVFFSYLLWFHSCRTSFNCIFLMLWTENRKMPLYLSEHFRIWNILENVKKWLALQILTCIIIHNHVQSRIISLPTKGKTIHRMYRNHDYFGDGSVYDTWRPLTIQTIWCSFFEKNVVLNFRFLFLVII